MEAKQKIKYSNVDEYIALQPENTRAGLKKLRDAIKKGAPQAEECISYQMPALKFHGMLAFYAAFKNHHGLYFMPPVIQAFKDKLTEYELSKATIKFPFGSSIPVKLVTEMARYSASNNLNKKQLKEAANFKSPKNKTAVKKQAV
jgi:uncharacterized protein YdhG (YjbR/CyaY superfamily)